MNNWNQFFPFKNPRKEQIHAIEFALSSFNSGKKYVIIEAPTGIGKSAIAITLARYYQAHPENNLPSAYVLTTQKILQEQYKNDFPYIANISAKQNYVCEHKIGGLTCDFGLKIQKVVNKTNFLSYLNNCVYMREKRKFDTSDIGVTNLPFFLSHAIPDRRDIKDRELIVIDECHNLESSVISYATVQFTKHNVIENLKVKWPNIYKMKIDDFMEWVSSIYAPALQRDYNDATLKVENSMSEAFLTSNSGLSLIKKSEDLGRQIESLSKCIDDFNSDEWVMSVSPTEDVVTITPLYARNYTKQMIFGFGKKILLMSATVLDKKTYCNNVGIPEDEASFVSLDSPFKIENRPIFLVNVGSMSKTNIDNTLPYMVKAIKQLLDDHKTEKGIIHTNSYKIAQYICNNIGSDRLLLHNSDDRHDILNLHLNTKQPTVLISPSFTEGIDLVDDLSRFQILVKCPYPYLGDNYIRTKMEKIKGWYEWSTAKTIIQASGRSVRHSDDYCITYALDSDISYFLTKNSYLFPKWWKKAVQNT